MDSISLCFEPIEKSWLRTDTGSFTVYIALNILPTAAISRGILKQLKVKT